MLISRTGGPRLGHVKSGDALTEQFRARGLKVTPQRQSIFRALSSSTEHPTAEAVYATVSAEMPTISLRTVYQTLNDLAAMGELNARSEERRVGKEGVSTVRSRGSPTH